MVACFIASSTPSTMTGRNVRAVTHTQSNSRPRMATELSCYQHILPEHWTTKAAVQNIRRLVAIHYPLALLPSCYKRGFTALSLHTSPHPSQSALFLVFQPFRNRIRDTAFDFGSQNVSLWIEKRGEQYWPTIPDVA